MLMVNTNWWFYFLCNYFPLLPLDRKETKMFVAHIVIFHIIFTMVYFV